MDSLKPEKMKFPTLCRSYRVAAGLKQREVADAIGVRPSSYGNVESVNHKCIALDRVQRFARFFQLDDAAHAELMAAWEELPVSAYAQKQAVGYAARREFRSKARNHDRLKVSLLELSTLLVTTVDNAGELCTCEPRDPASLFDGEAESCELCTALQLLGLSGWTSREEVIEKLAAVQEAM